MVVGVRLGDVQLRLHYPAVFPNRSARRLDSRSCRIRSETPRNRAFAHRKQGGRVRTITCLYCGRAAVTSGCELLAKISRRVFKRYFDPRNEIASYGNPVSENLRFRREMINPRALVIANCRPRQFWVLRTSCLMFRNFAGSGKCSYASHAFQHQREPHVLGRQTKFLHNLSRVCQAGCDWSPS